MARICREAGARVMTNVLVRDLDLNLHDHVDAHRLEIVVDGLPLFGGAQQRSVKTTRQDPEPQCGTEWPAWWSSQARSEGVGLLKLPISCPVWPQPKRAPFHRFCKSARAWLGDGDGRVF